MQDLLSIMFFANFIIIGFLFPKWSGWIIMATVPLLGPTGFTIMGSSFMPLTIYRVGYAVTFGMVLYAIKKKYPIFSVFKFPYVKVLMFFIVVIFLLSFSDRMNNMIFNFIPNHLFAIMLPFLIINNQESLFKLLKIYVFFSAIMSIILIFEVFGNFSIGGIIAEYFVPAVREGLQGASITSIVDSQSTRGSFLHRGYGLWGGERTAYLMTFLFPLTLWYMLYNDLSKFNPIKYFPFILSIFSLFLMQTRVTFIIVIVELFIITLLYAIFLDNKLLKQFFSLVIKLVMFVVISYIVLPSNITYGAINFFNYLFIESLYGGQLSMEIKMDRIPIAISVIMESPIWGHLVSRHHAYGILMRYEDLPGPLIYMISGGFILLTLYLIMLFKMPFDLYNIMKLYKYENKMKVMFIYVIAALLGGCLINFSNYSEAHFVMMFIIYVSIYKVYKFKM